MNRELAGVVAERLVAEGWVVRDLQQPYGVTLTRAGPGGVLLVVELLPTSFGLPGRRNRQRQHLVRVGAGYGPALELMPLLTLRVRPILVDRRFVTVAVTGPDENPGDDPPAADQIVAVVGEHAAALAARFPDVDTLAAEVSGRERLVLMAALGRAEEVRALLAEELAAEGAGPGPADRRFVRQLTRRLEQGLPPAPPVEQTLAVVAPAPGPLPDRRTRWATARARERLKRAAYRAARRQATGRSRDQVKALVAAEFRARGLDVDLSDVVLRTTMIELRRRRFGMARAVVAGAAMTGGAIRDVVREFRAAGSRTGGADPDWLRPPDRAGYRVPTDGRYDAVRLDAAGRARLVRVRAQATRRIGPWVLVDAWLTRDPAGPVTVHIGKQPVGTVDNDDGRYDNAFTAAALFDEEPVLTARLVPDPEPILELPRPRSGQGAGHG